MYSQDLINNLFRHPYTKISYLMSELQVTRLTATRYLDRLAEMGMLQKVKVGRSNYYINEQLFSLLSSKPVDPQEPVVKTIS
jgi:Fic family protein